MSTVTSPIVKDSTAQTIATKLDNINNTLDGNTNLAPIFNTSTAYSKGDMVNYNGDLYVFTANHAAGAWTGSDAVQTKVSTEISSLKSGLTNVVYGRHEVTSMCAGNNWCYFNLPKATTYTLASVGIVGGSNIQPDAINGYTIAYSYPDRGFIMIELHGTSATDVKANNYIVIARVDVA